MDADAAGSGGWFGGPVPPVGSGAAADEAAQVAGRLATPSARTTRAGLPIRVPRAHLVPGAFGAAAEPKSSTRDTPPPPDRSAEEIRAHLADHHQGILRARPD